MDRKIKYLVSELQRSLDEDVSGTIEEIESIFEEEDLIDSKEAELHYRIVKDVEQARKYVDRLRKSLRSASAAGGSVSRKVKYLVEELQRYLDEDVSGTIDEIESIFEEEDLIDSKEAELHYRIVKDVEQARKYVDRLVKSLH